MTETARRKSSWPEPGGSSSKEHTHRLPKALRIVLGALVVGLLALTVAVAVLLAYILDVREYRSKQLQVVNDRINESICDLLDQFPEGGLLVRPRDKYGCGPGIPISAYPPDVQDDLNRRPKVEPQTVAPKTQPAWPDTGSAPNTSEDK